MICLHKDSLSRIKSALNHDVLSIVINGFKTVAIFNTSPPHENSIHLGTYFQVANPKFGFWNNLNLRSGGYLKELDFTGEKYIDYGFTFGLGLEYLSNTQTFDIALRILV